MKKTCLASGFAALTFCAAAFAAREESVDPIWHLGGFGTLGAGYHSTEGIRFRRDLEQPLGYEGGRIGFRGDTRLGVQASATFDPHWSVLVQAVSRLNSESNWEPQLSWTFLRYAPVDGLDVRLGRLGVDIFLDSDSRHLGYAFTTIRPPPEVLGVVTQDVFDGMDVTMRRAFGAGVASLRLYGGRSRGDSYFYGHPYTPPATRRLGATLEWSYEALTLRLALSDSHTRNDMALTPLATALASLPVPLARTRASQIDTAHHLVYSGIGALYERGPFSAQGLVSWQRFSQFPTYEGWGTSLTMGYRIGAWKPYLSYSRLSFEPQEERDLSLSAPYAALQSAYDKTVDRLTMHQHTVALGVRYDFARDYALKFQIDRVHAAESILLIDSNGMPGRNVDMTLYSIALDFVF